MTPKEALENIEREIQQRINDMVVDGCDLESVLAIESYIRNNLEIIKQALTDYEQLQVDVKRFMELDCDDKTFSKEETEEFVELVNKPLKVGKS